MTEKSMRRTIKAIYFLIPFLLISPSVIAFQCKVTRVFDGDTLLCRLGHDSIKVRLAGIDAPETSNKNRKAGQPYSQQAKKHLAKQVLNEVVDIKGYGLDTYNRILGELFIDGKSVNLELIQLGLAEVYKGELPKNLDSGPFIAAEKKAKGSLKGMWSLGDKYVSPREWRKETQ
jgi:micrococcal nuclease